MQSAYATYNEIPVTLFSYDKIWNIYITNVINYLEVF